MKSIYMILLGAMVLLTFANCGKKDEKRASLDMSAECYSRAVLSNTTQNYYGQQQAYAGAPCSYNWNALQSYGITSAQSSGSFGYASGGGAPSCSYGEMIYSPTKGTGCVQMQAMVNVALARYVLDPNRGIFTLANSAPTYYQQQQYYNTGINGVQTLRACDEAEQCPAGQRCAPTSQMAGAQPPIGVCAF